MCVPSHPPCQIEDLYFDNIYCFNVIKEQSLKFMVVHLLLLSKLFVLARELFVLSGEGFSLLWACTDTNYSQIDLLVHVSTKELAIIFLLALGIMTEEYLLILVLLLLKYSL